MTKGIIDIFRRQAQQHKTIKAFYYNKNYELGSGKEKHPLFWLEDPIYGKNENNVFACSLNFAMLFVPDKDRGIVELQDLAFSIGLNIIERIKREDNGVNIRPDWSFVTLSDYYDNGACGCRFSVNMVQANMQNRCLIDEQFDTDKVFDEDGALSDFDISPAGNCEVYVSKFPVFNLKTSK